jgi:predicted TPR repeat methyltransferase
MRNVSYFDCNRRILKLNNEYVANQLSRVSSIVLDLGCGKRPYENEMLSVAERYIGVDWSNALHRPTATCLI